MPWFDYSGRFSPLKFTVFVSLFLPAIWTAYLFWHGDFGAARPVNEAIHEIGRWTIRLLFLSLTISSLCWILDRLLFSRIFCSKQVVCMLMYFLVVSMEDNPTR